MAKYTVMASAYASWKVGTYEADDEKEAIKKAENDNNGAWEVPSLCWQCSEDLEVEDDVQEITAYKSD